VDKLNVNWSLHNNNGSIEIQLACFERYLQGMGLRPSTIEMHIFRAGKYLRSVEGNQPTTHDFKSFREKLLERKLSRNTVNNYCQAISHYHKMIKDPATFNYLKPDDRIPYYFEPEEVIRIFDSVSNLKHLAMLKTLFYGCLRASELCNLDDIDLDLKTLTLRIRSRKGGQDGIVYTSSDCAETLNHYLSIRPSLIINGRQPLFYTDYGRHWDRIKLYKVFAICKRKAGLAKPGGLHVFSRHTPASMLIRNGCDIMTVRDCLRHKSINTTIRYLHVSDAIKREKYDCYLARPMGLR
jgi:integrase/recombinase XerD